MQLLATKQRVMDYLNSNKDLFEKMNEEDKTSQI
jgi:hypothetical protein